MVFGEYAFEKTFRETPFEKYQPIDHGHWVGWVKIAIDQILNGELKPFYMAEEQETQPTEEKCSICSRMKDVGCKCWLCGN
jgi:hypothetical protein